MLVLSVSVFVLAGTSYRQHSYQVDSDFDSDLRSLVRK